MILAGGGMLTGSLVFIMVFLTIIKSQMVTIVHINQTEMHTGEVSGFMDLLAVMMDTATLTLGYLIIIIPISLTTIMQEVVRTTLTRLQIIQVEQV